MYFGVFYIKKSIYNHKNMHKKQDNSKKERKSDINKASRINIRKKEKKWVKRRKVRIKANK